MAAVYCVNAKTFKMITAADIPHNPGGTLVGRALYLSYIDMTHLRVNAQSDKMAAKVRKFMIVGHLVLDGKAELAFVEDVTDDKTITTGDSLQIVLTNTNGGKTVLGPYKIPHDTACFQTNSTSRELGEDLMHALARQDPLPVIHISIEKIADKG